MNMKSRKTTVRGIAVCAASLLTLSIIAAHAQDPNGGGQAGQGQQQGGRGGGFGGGRRGGQGGPGGMPFAAGTITGGDANNGTITINSQFGGGSQTIKVSENTEFDTQETISVKDLKVGDSVVVQGLPATITASTITAGDPPAFMGGRRGGQPGGQPGGFNGGQPNGQNPQGGQPGQQQQPIQANANAVGKISSTNPLTVRVSDTVEVVLKLAKDAKITRYKKVPFSSLKVGDVIFAQGQTGQDGTFNATGVGVNMQMGGGGRGFGGFGGGFGGPGGGFGGPGGGGFGGGFGGGGRRGGRGGGANGGGTNGGDPGNNN